MHLIEHYLVRMADPPEPRCEGQCREHGEGQLVVPISLHSILARALQLYNLLVRGTIEQVGARVWVWRGPALTTALADSSWG